jgi:hypothetical protein
MTSSGRSRRSSTASWAAVFSANIAFARGRELLRSRAALAGRRLVVAVEEQFYLVWPLLIAPCSLG